MLNAGKYNARIIEVAWGESKSSGNVYLLARFSVTSGDCQGQTCTKMFHFTDAALERTVEDLRVCGWQGVNPAEINETNLCGVDANEVSITVQHEPYTDQNTGEDKVSAKVQWINPLNKPLTSTASQSAVTAFGERMKGRIAALNAKAVASGTRPMQSQQSAPQRAASANATPRPTPQPRAQPAPQRPPAKLPPSGAGEFDSDDIPF